MVPEPLPLRPVAREHCCSFASLPSRKQAGEVESEPGLLNCLMSSLRKRRPEGTSAGGARELVEGRTSQASTQ